MKGIILAGGVGSRLYPSTGSISKQLLPVYNKPMIYYPICTLMKAGISEILIIVAEGQVSVFRQLLGNGSQWGIHIQYEEQIVPDGVASSLKIADKFVGDDCCTLILGDNLFYGEDVERLLLEATIEARRNNLSSVFGCEVKDPQRFGVVEFNKNGRVTSLVEKPKNPPSNYAVTGLYVYSRGVIDRVSELQKSARNEYEITDLNNLLIKDETLLVKLLGENTTWLDTGTFESLLKASEFISSIENTKNILVSCPELTAYTRGFVTLEQLVNTTAANASSPYGEYIRQVLQSIYESNGGDTD